MKTNQDQNTEFIQSVNDFLHSKLQEIETSEGKKGLIVIAIEEIGDINNACLSIIGQEGILIEGLADFIESDPNGRNLIKAAAKKAMLNKLLKGIGGGCDCEDCKEKKTSSQPADGGDTTPEPEGQTA